MWSELSKPFLVLAPMDDVTDVVFREIVAQVAPPDVFFTEFTNVDALWSAGREAHMHRLLFTENQRPIVAQIWGREPENYYKTAQMLKEMGFDAIDINMGCPDKNVMKSGTCSALIENRTLADEIISATKEGARNLPVSVKTRLGINEIITEDWIGWLLELDLAVITIHGRTVREMSKVPAHWDEIGRAVQVRDASGKQTLIVGNGDVTSYEQAQQYAIQYGVDGVMIGRGVFEDLWIFDPARTASAVSLSEKLQVLERHIRSFDETWRDRKNPDLMKKFLRVYVSGFPGASRLRQQLMEAPTLSDMADVVAQVRVS